MKERSSPSKWPYIPFAITAGFYVCGVLLLTGWLYVLHRASLYEQTDQGLRSAVLATRELAGTGRARTHILNGLTNAPVFLQHQERFNRFAKAGDLSLLAMARREEDKTFLLIASDQSVYPNGHPVGRHGESLPDELVSAVEKLSPSSGPEPRFLTFRTQANGAHSVYIAALYEPEDQTNGFLYLAGKNGKELDTELKALLIRKLATALFMLGMMIPLMLLFNRVQRRHSENLAEFNTRLQQDMEKKQQREMELKEAIRDMERFSQVAAGREMRIIELKSEVNELLLQLDRDARYNIDRID